MNLFVFLKFNLNFILHECALKQDIAGASFETIKFYGRT